MKSEASIDSDGDSNDEKESIHEGLEFVQCNFCGKAFIIKLDVDAGTEAKSRKGVYSCNQCRKEPVPTEDSLKLERDSEPENFPLNTDSNETQSQEIWTSNKMTSDVVGQPSDGVESVSSPVMSPDDVKVKSLIKDNINVDEQVLIKENLTSQSVLSNCQPREYINHCDDSVGSIGQDDKLLASGNSSSSKSNHEIKDDIYDSSNDNQFTKNVPSSSKVFIAVAPHFKSLRASNVYNSDTLEYIKALEEYNTTYQERNGNTSHSSVPDENNTASGSHNDSMSCFNANDPLPISLSLDSSLCDSLEVQNAHINSNSLLTMSSHRQLKKRRHRARGGEKQYETAVREETGSAHSCTYCGMPFSDLATLTVHTKEHTGEEDNMCMICNKVIKKHYELKIHVRGHTGHKPFQCSICSVRFLKYSQLTKHGRIHSGEKPFKCKICFKDFPRGDNLRKHLRTHSGERPYKCTYCPWEFAEHGQLRKHIRIHTGEKPFKCTLCPKAFPRKENLQKHTRTHTGEKPFKCTFCEWKFAECSHLIRHTNRAHLGIKDDRKKQVMNYATRMNFKIQRMNYQSAHGSAATPAEEMTPPTEEDVMPSNSLPST